MPTGDEFDLIARHFAPLANDPAARGLLDDAAFWPVDGPLVLTCDAIVEGVHFLPDDPLDQIARKAVRVNVSDLAAKGARAEGLLVCLMWPQARPARDLALFAQGLQSDLAHFAVRLLGGDTTTTPGPLSIAVTAIGRLAGPRCPARADAEPGEDLWVSGAIGDGYLGLLARRGAIAGPATALAALTQRYQAPDARAALAGLMASHAGAAMDVSDGLIADAGKIAAASGVGLRIEASRIPLSQAAIVVLGANPIPPAQLYTGGDDYELLFTAPQAARSDIIAAGASAGVELTQIGQVVVGAGVEVVGADGGPLPGLERGGFIHRFTT
jgi:thiamine-monophosphate kinase